MGSRIQCFWLEPTQRVRLRLRRYKSSGHGDCPGEFKYHNASVLFLADDGSPSWPVRYCTTRGHEDCLDSYDDVGPAHDDPRWPAHCEACDYAFVEEDHWQVFQEQIYQRVDDGSITTLRDAPPGAMYDAKWYPGKGPDGIALCVCLPPGGGLDYWHVDGPAKGGGGWTREGKLPNVTATPSILTPRYHGFLRNGFLEEC